MAKLSIDEVVARDVALHADLPAVPDFGAAAPDMASVEYSVHRTKLSTHRTALSSNRTEMSGRRTGMSFQRTRMSADRTLMSVIRTSLSLIGFGFTIFQFFQRLQEKNVIAGDSHAARNFGAALVWLGVGMVIVGIVYHVQFMLQLRHERDGMRDAGLIHGQSGFPISLTLLVALALLAIGLAAIVSLAFHVGPFG
jgi:putative membrane protein